MLTPRLNCRSTTSMWDTHTKRPFQAFTLWRKPHFTITHLVQRVHMHVRAHTHTTVSQSRERVPVLNGWLIFLNATRILKALGAYNCRRLLLLDSHMQKETLDTRERSHI